MNWKLKGAVVEKVEHPTTKRTGVIRLDKGRMTFYARADDNDHQAEPFSSSDGAEVRRWLLEQLKFTGDADRLDWLPVIEVKYGGRDWYGYRDQEDERTESIEVKIDRYFIALTQDQRQWRKLDWQFCDPHSSALVPDNERFSQSKEYGRGPKGVDANRYTHEKPFRLPSFERDGKAIIGYTVELWAALTMIVDQIKANRETLAKLIGTKAGVAALTEVGAGRQPLLLGKGDA